MINIVMIAAMMLVFWLFFIRPQAKKQKDQANFLENLAKGDEVVTASGLIGKVNKIEDNEVSIQLDQKTFVRVTKGSVSREMTEAFSSAK